MTVPPSWPFNGTYIASDGKRYAIGQSPPAPSGGGSPAGVGISSATVNGSGNLILTLSDNTSINAGHVVGAPGSPGTPGSSAGSDSLAIHDADFTGEGVLLAGSGAGTFAVVSAPSENGLLLTADDGFPAGMAWLVPDKFTGVEVARFTREITPGSGDHLLDDDQGSSRVLLTAGDTGLSWNATTKRYDLDSAMGYLVTYEFFVMDGTVGDFKVYGADGQANYVAGATAPSALTTFTVTHPIPAGSVGEFICPLASVVTAPTSPLFVSCTAIIRRIS